MKEKIFSRYDTFVIVILTLTQFTLILDFVVLSPLGALLMPALKITPAQFGMVVAAYAFSAGISGFLAAGFADRYDRKKLLLFFYSGFIVGTLLCGLVETYELLLAARIFTGVFGGVIGSISFAIVTDLFRMEVRGRVMGFLQMAFAGSQVLGLPIGWELAVGYHWHFPFLMIVGISVLIAVAIALWLKPVRGHLALQKESNPMAHFKATLVRPDYIKGFLATTLLATGGFMLMPFASAYGINNIKLREDQLSTLYVATGVCSMAIGPMIGKLTDRVGKYKMFVIGTIWSIVIVMVYCLLPVTPLWAFIIVSIVMFTGVSSRMISSQALLSAVPDPKDRGAFMSINSSVQQVSGGLATILAGLIIVQAPSGRLENYPLLGGVVSAFMVITIVMMYSLHLMVQRKISVNSNGHGHRAEAAVAEKKYPA